MSDSITATAGFFWNDAVSPTTATDLLTAVETAQANVNSALTAETNAAASATAAASSALSAAGAQTAAATSETNAANSATAAAGSVTSANTAASAAAGSATSAATQATIATTQASNSLSSANAAASSATAAANSATNAATSATGAAASATTASNAAATIPAPTSHATQYLRVNSSGNAYEQRTVAQVASDIGVLHDAGRNKLHNALFVFWQRGNSFTANGYTADRWILTLGGSDTCTTSKAALSDADRTAIGDEEAALAVQNVVGGTSSAGYTVLSQRIESVRRLSGKTVTVSFYAKALSGTPKVGISIDQLFGTGGSPSSSVQGSGTAVTITSGWNRYSVQIAIPSVSGQTLGTNADDCSQLNVWFSSGTTNATRAGSIGVQSNTVSVWGIQLEVGTVLTALEKLDIRNDLANCQRFYCAGNGTWGAGSGIGVPIFVPHAFPVSMRAAPTVTQNLSGGGGYTAGTPASTTTAVILEATASAASSVFNYAFTASADL